MPITFISLNKTFIEKVKLLGFEGYTMRIQDYIPKEIVKHIMFLPRIPFALWMEELISP